MQNIYAVKEYRFPGSIVLGSLAGGSAFSVGSTNYSLNGEILSVQFKTNTTGSLFLLESGPAGQELIWSSKAPSGTNLQIAYPAIYPVDNTNTSISGAGGTVFNRVVNGQLVLGGSGPDSGLVTIFNIRYR